MRFQDLGKRGVLQNLDPGIILEEPGWNERKDEGFGSGHGVLLNSLLPVFMGACTRAVQD